MKVSVWKFVVAVIQRDCRKKGFAYQKPTIFLNKRQVASWKLDKRNIPWCSLEKLQFDITIQSRQCDRYDFGMKVWCSRHSKRLEVNEFAYRKPTFFTNKRQVVFVRKLKFDKTLQSRQCECYDFGMKIWWSHHSKRLEVNEFAYQKQTPSSDMEIRTKGTFHGAC